MNTCNATGSRPHAEAQIELTAVARLPEMLRLLEAVVAVIDMSDPEHASFADSGADCLDALLVHEEVLRAILVEFGVREPKPFSED